MSVSFANEKASILKKKHIETFSLIKFDEEIKLSTFFIVK